MAEHEACDKGFDIQRRNGDAGSMVQVICNGCGESIEYSAASSPGTQTRELEAALAKPERRRETAALSPRENGVRDPAPAKRVPSRRPSGAGNGAAPPKAPAVPVAHSASTWPSWLSTALIAALIGGGLLMVVLGLSSSDDNGSETSAPAGSSGAPAVSHGAAQRPTAPPAASPKPAVPQGTTAVRLTRRRFADRVAVGVPKGWEAGISGGAVAVTARDGDCRIQVYYEEGTRSRSELGRRTRDFLLQRHPGARIEGPRPTRRAGTSAQLVRSFFDGGSESAWAFAAGGYSYLAVELVTGGASATDERRADAVLASIRPL